MPAKLKIGIFGGTFNPIHKGHIKLAKSALKDLKLDRIYFVPAYMPPHKVITETISPLHRKNMVSAAIKQIPKFKLCLFELNKKRKSYSIDTIKYFKKKYAQKADLYFLIGADSLKTFGTWKEAKKLPKLVKFVSYDRPGYCIEKNRFSISAMSGLNADISSHEIRARVRRNKGILDAVPKKVAVYIKRHKLYQK